MGVVFAFSSVLIFWPPALHSPRHKLLIPTLARHQLAINNSYPHRSFVVNTVIVESNVAFCIPKVHASTVNYDFSKVNALPDKGNHPTNRYNPRTGNGRYHEGITPQRLTKYFLSFAHKIALTNRNETGCATSALARTICVKIFTDNLGNSGSLPRLFPATAGKQKLLKGSQSFSEPAFLSHLEIKFQYFDYFFNPIRKYASYC